MTRNQIKKMIMDVLAVADYDLMKAFLPETAEEPEYAEAEMENLIDIAAKHINAPKKPKAKSKKRKGYYPLAGRGFRT